MMMTSAARATMTPTLANKSQSAFEIVRKTRKSGTASTNCLVAGIFIEAPQPGQGNRETRAR